MKNKLFNIFLWALTAKYAFITLYALFSIKILFYCGLLVDVLIIFFCIRFLKYRSRQRPIAIMYCLFLIGLTIWGFNNHNWIKYISMDILVWGLGMVILLSSQDRDRILENKLPKLIGAWMIVGVPISWYLMYKSGYAPGSSLLGERFNYSADLSEQAYGVFAPIQPIYVSSYILPFFSELKGIRRIAVLLGVGTILMFGLFTSTRQFVIVPIVAFCSIIIGKNKIYGKSISLKIRYLLYLGIFFFSFWIIVYGTSSLQKTLDSVNVRLVGNITNIAYENRFEELEIYWHAQSPLQKIVGRGIGGSNTTWMWEKQTYGVSMLHFGFAHVLLKGGIIFVLFIYSLTIWALHKLWRYPEKRSWFWILVIFTVTCMTHTEWGFSFPVIFFWLSISQAANCGTPAIHLKRK